MDHDLEIQQRYSRDDVAQAFGEDHGRGGKWMSGVVPVGDDELALFITLDKSGYSGEHRYEDAFESPSRLRWQSQTRASPDNAWGQKHIEGGPDRRPHHLFVRSAKGDKFVYCGQVRYLDHESANPMTVWWELLDPLPPELYEDFEAATDHAGGRVPTAQERSRQMNIQPPAEDLRDAVERQDPETYEGPAPYEMEDPPWGWASPLEEFIDADLDKILDSLVNHHDRRFRDLPIGGDQKAAWRRTIRVFQATLEPLTKFEGGAETLVALEYELPGEDGRRPDVILVTPNHEIFVVECKNRRRAGTPALDQAVRYKEDLEAYHSETHDRPVHPYLGLLRDDAVTPEAATDHPVTVLTPSDTVLVRLQDDLRRALKTGSQSYDPETWLRGDYAPLPHLMQAVIATFEERELPRLKSVHSSNVPDAVDTIHQLATEAQDQQKHILALVTGAPGSGKTLVGVESTIRASQDGIDSLFLSGNGPLVAVLQDALDRAGAAGAAKGLVRPMYKFKQGVTRNLNSAPARVYVFDEGQRAWDADKNKNYDGSEIELLLDVASRRDWGVVVGLIGEGQEIYKGEEGALETWLSEYRRVTGDDASWELAMPDRDVTPDMGHGPVHRETCLHLDMNIRAKSAHRLHEWVEAVLAGRVDAAADLSYDLQQAGYPIHVTSSREQAETYVQRLFEEAPDPRYGWVISSAHRKGSDPEGMSAPYVRTWEMTDVWGPWFNAPPGDPASGCQLEIPCPEFGCQGLELDFVLVFWGDDLTWRDGEWLVRDGVRDWSEDPREHTINAYRVLLTRGRERMVIRCREEDTRRYLERCGATPIVDLE